ncbi:MAG: hypothetical protein IJY20_03400 [Clostridia bacterium]|nr:hypothetical protein [Clostridia bacterium]
MFERISTHLRENFKNAWRTVIGGWRQFFPFFFALLFIQLLLFSVTLGFDSNFRNEKAIVEKEYNYHLAIKGLNEGQTLTLINDPRTVFSNDYVYDVVSTSEHTVEGMDSSYDVYIRFVTGNKHYGIYGIFKKDTIQSCYSTFSYTYHDVYAPEGGTATLYFSPLYQLETLWWQNYGLMALVLTLLSLLCAAILGRIYRIRLNHDRFTYGIYVTFGADGKRLRTTAFWEMLLCALLSLLPAGIGAWLVCNWLYGSVGLTFTPGLKTQLWVPICIIPILYLAVRLPMKLLAQKEPMTLITAMDNSHYVKHPARSATMHLHRFPRFYELLSTLRYHRYYLKLAVSSALLCALFISGTYLAQLYQINRDIRIDTETSFHVDIGNIKGMPSDFIEEIEALPRVKSVYKDHASYSLEANGMFLAVNKSDLVPFSGVMNNPIDNKTSVFNTVKLLGAQDEDLIELFESTYTIEGDLSSVLRDENTIALGNSINNRTTFAFEVGDTITLATPILIPETAEINQNLTGNALLEEQILQVVYEYKTYTIGAIMTNYPSAAGGTPMIAGPALYEAITGKSVTRHDLNIIIDPDITPTQYINLENEIRALAATGYDISITSKDTYFANRMERQFNYERLALFASALMLTFIPLVWFFSQLFFYRKRAIEFNILRVLSAPMGDIRRLHLQSTVLVLPIAAISLLVAGGCVLAVYLLVQYILPSMLHISGSVVLPLTASPLPFFVCFVLTFLCSIASSLIPYWIYKRRQTHDPMEFFNSEDGI